MPHNNGHIFTVSICLKKFIISIYVSIYSCCGQFNSLNIVQSIRCGIAISGTNTLHHYINLIATKSIQHIEVLTQCGLVTPYGVTDLGQHWLR